MSNAQTPAMEWMSAVEVADLVRRRELSPVELVDGLLLRIGALNPTLHAYLTVTASQAREAAVAAERAVRDGEPLGPLHGVPLSVKDLEHTAGVRTTYGSVIYRDHVPEADAIAVERLRAAGAILLGKTNCPEFGLLGETRNLLGGEARNPHDLGCTTGGSSGGAAAAVAAGLGPLALGDDGAGSVVAPASFCGVYGMKPTRGRVPFGPEDPQSLLYTDVGPLARSVRDLALMLEAMAGPDARDPLSLRDPFEAWEPERAIGHLRVAFTPDFGHFPVDPAVAGAVERAAGMLSRLGLAVEAATPDVPNPWPIYEPLFLADTWALLGELAEAHPDDFVPDAHAEVMPGRDVTAADVVRGLDAWWRFRRQVEDFFTRFDVLLMPVTAVPAFPLGSPPSRIGGQEVRPYWTTFMPFPVAWNMCGAPEVSVPCGRTDDGLPLAVLVVTAHGRDDVALAVAAALADCAPIEQPVVEPVAGAADEALWT